LSTQRSLKGRSDHGTFGPLIKSTSFLANESAASGHIRPLPCFFSGGAPC
jgi:hypothetical protein